MTWRDTARAIGMSTPTRRVVIAMNYLERHGQSFCADFGTDNAVEKAREMRRKIKLARALEQARKRLR